ncbi:MAG: YdbH domain-containing protein [Lacunisphaera sp.]|nr:YdbH domain-containing protein [Lacunisphaera sp.]
MPLLTKRRLLGTAAAVLVLLAAGVAARLALTGLALRTLLAQAGAAEIKFDLAAASPWAVVVENMDFRVRTQAFAARRLTLHRTHWWTPSLGALRIEGARLPLTVDGSDTNALSWATYQNGQTPAVPPRVPLEEIYVDGQLIIKAAALPDQALAVKIEAHLTADNKWTGRASAEGPGLAVKAEGTFNPATKALDFHVPEIALDLKPWQQFVQRLALLPGGGWDLAGQATASAEGRWAGKEFTATARVRLRGGHAAHTEHAVAADGVEADLEFSDLDHFRTKPGTLRIAELRTGRLTLRDVDAEFAFEEANKIVVTRATLKGLGGTAALEPFKYFLNQRELEAVVLVEGINIEEVMALTQDLPAKATGRVNGRFPIRVDDTGVRLGTGWLQLTPGVAAEIQFNAAGLLTRGLSTNSPSYAVLKKVESGLLKLAISELRLDLRPPNAPPGRSATLHIAGQPLDPGVKAPVTLDLNVNGPLEKLLNMGLDSRLNFGTGK